jgi:hypothetical protein
MTHIEPDPGRSIHDLPYDTARARAASLRGDHQRSRSNRTSLAIVDRVRDRIGRAFIALGATIAPSAAAPSRRVRSRSVVSR